MVKQPGSQLRLLAGRSHPNLASQISRRLNVSLSGVELDYFANGEISCHIEESVRGRDVFVIQTHSPSVNDHIMEQALIIDAAKRASAKSITAICPFFGYSREPYAARLVANILLKAGADRISAIDLHEPITKVADMSAEPLFIGWLQKLPKKDLVIVSPDAGRAKFVEKLGRRLGCGWAVISKKRQDKLIEMKLDQGKVKSKVCVLVDDIIDTGSTICAAADLLTKNGAIQIYAITTHGLFSSSAIDRIHESRINKVIVTDSVPTSALKNPKVEILPVAPLIADDLRKFIKHN